MKVSIIIPSYNQQEFLSDAIDSALGQSVPCEVIVIDDGSTDSSFEIAKGYGDRIQLVSQVNKGLASARNTGIMWATGDYVLPLDADDILLENCVKSIIKHAQSTDADVISPSFRCFGTRNSDVILMPNPRLEDFKVGNRVGYCSAIKREALLEVGAYSPRMTLGYEDFHLWFDLLTRGKRFVTIPEVLWLYRTKEKSMWTEARDHHEELMAQIYKDFPLAK